MMRERRRNRWRRTYGGYRDFSTRWDRYTIQDDIHRVDSEGFSAESKDYADCYYRRKQIMRDSNNMRARLGQEAKQAFNKFLADRKAALDAMNDEWSALNDWYKTTREIMGLQKGEGDIWDVFQERRNLLRERRESVERQWDKFYNTLEASFLARDQNISEAMTQQLSLWSTECGQYGDMPFRSAFLDGYISDAPFQPPPSLNDAYLDTNNVNSQPMRPMDRLPDLPLIPTFSLVLSLFILGFVLFAPDFLDRPGTRGDDAPIIDRASEPVQPLTFNDAEESVVEEDSEPASGSFITESNAPVINVEQPPVESSDGLCAANGGVQWQGETCVCSGFIDQVTICNDGAKIDNVTTTACSPDANACAAGGGGGGDSGGGGGGGSCQPPSGGCAEGWVWFQESCTCENIN